MKKLFLTVIVLLSFCLTYFSHDQVNTMQGTRIYSESYIIEKNLNQKTNYLFIDIEKDSIPLLYNVLIEYAKDKDITYLIQNSMKNEDGITNNTDNIIYTRHQKILDGIFIDNKKGIDFSSTSDRKYYSTEIDKNSSGYIRILDNDLFKDSQDIFKFMTINYLKDIIDITTVNTLKIPMRVYVESSNQVNELIEYLKLQIPEVTVEIWTMDSVGRVTDDQNIAKENADKILGLIVISVITILISLIIKSNRKYILKKMMGISSFRIVLNEFGILFLSVFLLFTLSQVLFFFMFCKELNQLSQAVFNQMILSFVYCIAILVFALIFATIFVSKVCSVKYLNSKTQLSKFIFIQMIIKVIVILIMIVPFLDALHNGYPFIKNYIAFQEMKDDANDLYYLHGIPDDYYKIYQHYVSKEHYIDFSDFYNHSTMNEMTVEGAIEDGYYDDLYKYPFISVNKKVISELNLKDENGKVINVDSLTYKNMLIPIEYKNKDLSNYHISLKEIIYVQNYDKVFNYKFENPFYLKNPMIIVMTEDSTNIQITSLRFQGNNAKEVQEDIYKVSSSERSQLRIVNSEYRVNYYSIMLERSLKEVGLILGMYLFISIIIMVQTFYIFINEESKRLAVSYLLGYSRMKRYLMLFIFNLVSYLAVFIGIFNLNVNKENALICLGFIALIELIYNYISLYIYEKKHMQNLLKGDK